MDKQLPVRLNVSSAQIIHQFNKHAGTYNKHSAVQHSMAQMVLHELDGLASNVTSLLEVGCGTGDLTALLIDQFPKARVTAIDIADQMIQSARQRVGANANVEFVVGDAEEIKWEGTFDVVVSNAVIQWFRNPVSTMLGLKRSLKRDGVMIHTTLGPESFSQFFLLLDRVEVENGAHSTGHRLPLFSLEQWWKVFELIEMDSIVMRSEVVEIEFGNSRAWLQSLKGTGAAINSGVATRPSCLQQVMRQYDTEHATPNGVVVPYEIITMATRNRN